MAAKIKRNTLNQRDCNWLISTFETFLNDPKKNKITFIKSKQPKQMTLKLDDSIIVYS